MAILESSSRYSGTSPVQIVWDPEGVQISEVFGLVKRIMIPKKPLPPPLPFGLIRLWIREVPAMYATGVAFTELEYTGKLFFVHKSIIVQIVCTCTYKKGEKMTRNTHTHTTPTNKNTV